MAHYIAMSGLCGCTPDYCQLAESKAEALDSLLVLFSEAMTESRERRFVDELVDVGIAGLQDVDGAGADYAEIVECDCKDPSVHTEGE